MNDSTPTLRPAPHRNAEPLVTLELVDSAALHREARRADLEWQPQDDRSNYATVSGIAPPGSATPSMTTLRQRAGTDSGARVLSSNPSATHSARARFLSRLVVVAILVTAYFYWPV
jgi:hypothetical protein